MKHLKALLAAYRLTLKTPAQTIADSLSCLERDEPRNQDDVDRIRTIIGAIVLDMKTEDAKAAKDAAK